MNIPIPGLVWACVANNQKKCQPTSHESVRLPRPHQISSTLVIFKLVCLHALLTCISLQLPRNISFLDDLAAPLTNARMANSVNTPLLDPLNSVLAESTLLRGSQDFKHANGSTSVRLQVSSLRRTLFSSAAQSRSNLLSRPYDSIFSGQRNASEDRLRGIGEALRVIVKRPPLVSCAVC